MDNYKHYQHSIGLATVHLVWIPCRRKPVFRNREDLKLRGIQVFQEVAHEKRWVIKAIEIASDHVHMLVEYDPTHSIAQVAKAFKGRAAK
ncbi:MAG: IS200/IS605 family transposase, partial [Waterburya sp.]